jgi:hypothetical protein
MSPDRTGNQAEYIPVEPPWSSSGCADGGVRAYAGVDRDEIPVTRAFWFAWSSFYPNTQVVHEFSIFSFKFLVFVLGWKVLDFSAFDFRLWLPSQKMVCDVAMPLKTKN